jgi:hypothetical protein
LVDKNGLRAQLDQDRRFSNWSKPDHHKVPYYDNPDTVPT